MDNELKGLIKEFLEKVNKKVVEDGREKIKNEDLKMHFSRLENLIKDTKTIIENKDKYDEKDFNEWLHTAGILEFDLSKQFQEEIMKRFNKLEEGRDA